MSLVRAYHLPSGHRPRTRTLRAGETELEIASPTIDEWAAVIDRLERARQRLRQRDLDDILAAVQVAFDKWHDINSPQRRLAEATLPSVTGFSASMIRYGLPRILAPLQIDSMRELLTQELRPTPRRTAVAPALLVHVLAGNIPGLGAVAANLSLAIGSPTILKTAAGDPLSTALWAQTIAEADPELGECLAVTYWPGGDVDTEAVVFDRADMVVASGSNESIAAIATRVRSRFRGHGHRVSFAAVGTDCLDDETAVAALARGLARDISVWDQQGCLSPQMCYVEAGGRVAPHEFATILAGALAADAVELPPRRLSLDEQAAVQRFRQEAEWTEGTTLLASEDSTAWSISMENEGRFRPTCLNRCVRLLAVSRLEDTLPALAPQRRHLEAAGLAVGPARRSELARRLGDIGVHRVCPLGKMQEPPLSWCQGGRPRVGDWVEWMEDETRDA